MVLLESADVKDKRETCLWLIPNLQCRYLRLNDRDACLGELDSVGEVVGRQLKTKDILRCREVLEALEVGWSQRNIGRHIRGILIWWKLHSYLLRWHIFRLIAAKSQRCIGRG